jgi:hypothetical protein
MTIWSKSAASGKSAIAASLTVIWCRTRQRRSICADPDVAVLVQQLLNTADELARRGSGGAKA